jgi:AraC-like DNA-binding protein
MVIYFIAAIPHAFIPWSEKVQAAHSLLNDHGFLLEYKSTLLDHVFPAVANYLIRLFLILGYLLWSIGIFINYLVKRKSGAVIIKQHFMKKWLFILLGSLLVLLLCQFLLVVKSFEMHFSDLFFSVNVFRIISAMSLTGLLISPFFFPSILYGMPRMPDHFNQDQDKPIKEVSSSIRQTNSFESDYIHSIEQKAELYMVHHQLYLVPDCNLAFFSKHLNVPAHHLAYYFREVKKKPFNEYRNEWRINHAKKLIEEGKAGEMTLEAIGMLSGFSSRNAFITDFKKLAGESPGSYAARFN